MEPYESKALFSYKNTPRLSAFDPDKQGVYFCSPYGVLAFEAEAFSHNGFVHRVCRYKFTIAASFATTEYCRTIGISC